MKQWEIWFDNEFDEEYFDEDLGNEGLFAGKEPIKEFIRKQIIEQMIEGITPDNPVINGYILDSKTLLELKQQMKAKWLS